MDLDRPAVDGSRAGAYQWWYFDAQSDDGRYGLAAIWFVGGVFSALYADRIADGVAASPFDHPMLNLAVYERGRRKTWVYSEYPREALEVDRGDGLGLRIGRSRLVREGRTYRFDVDDRDVPKGRDVRLSVTFTPEEPALVPPGAQLSRDGRHRWGSPAPRCRVSVKGDVAFEGWGYHDVNQGDEPLHHGFRHWSWSRVHLPQQTRLVYDAIEADGTRVAHLLVGHDGRLDRRELSDPPQGRLTPWLLRVPTKLGAGTWEGSPLTGRRERLWESSPFYARWASAFEADGRMLGRGICEHVDLRRFASPAVRWMLRHRIYRMRWPTLEPHPIHVSHRTLFGADRLLSTAPPSPSA